MDKTSLRMAVGLFVLLFNFFEVVQAQRQENSNTAPYEIFKNQVYPFLQQRCSECHGENKYGAPQHSPHQNPEESYNKIRGYVDFSSEWMKNSQLIKFGGTRHCSEYLYTDQCGADRSELVAAVKGWIEAEIKAKDHQKTSKKSAKFLLQEKSQGIKKSTTSPVLKIKQIVASDDYTCALFENHKVKCWGKTPFSPEIFGNNPLEMQRLSYLEINGDVLQMAAGIFHFCVLLKNGRAKCWGNNGDGQLGTGTAADTNSQKPEEDVLIDEKIVQLAASGHHTCAVLENGRAKCWGGDMFGELGIEQSVKMVGRSRESMLKLPDVMIDEKIIQIATGVSSTCALLEEGSVKCWGDNSSGQLGLAFDADKYGANAGEMKKLSAVKLGGKVTQISVQYDSVCAVLEDRGRVKCWGYNSKGQLGIGMNQRNIRLNADGMNNLPDVLIEMGVTQVLASAEFSCALWKNGRARCWGDNLYGQLGMGQSIESVGKEKEEMAVLGDVVIDEKISQLAVGSWHVCALLEDSRVKCWGNNSSYQLGSGDKISRGIFDEDSSDDVAEPFAEARP